LVADVVLVAKNCHGRRPQNTNMGYGISVLTGITNVNMNVKTSIILRGTNIAQAIPRTDCL
jgi:hypothetical protein